ncbi:NAD-dependent epimerase/dehydratase family protein [Prevotella sp. E9-3]|uniref:polysaccharide biosynthesis C-terminal domain-containing protein n=1 Tax=Prevotella sp. E9-3 TaxID=2913621 RepID=UPI001EDBC134|nr:NAD-dependent epimerase/dehydratase family protein [Prevotella sp. E9-3]UKK47478.1 NAD-dependent epimerase/dehydratase family protein [Prevotella sp. E9-3]
MKILVTGAKGFVGRNLCANLRNIQEGKDRRFPELKIEEIFEYDIDTDPVLLDEYCKNADFVFNLAGVNRPQNQEEFMQGNFGFASTLLDTLKKHKNTCPVMLSSSQQASLTGRFGNSEYGRSKKAGEDLFLDYERDFLKGQELENLRINSQTTENTDGTDKDFSNSQNLDNKGLRPRVLIYRFPNLFGKWCRPNYNSAVATFCNAFANDLPYTVNDPSVELELLYIDDLVDEMIACLKGEEHRCEFDGLEIIPTPNDNTTTDSTDNPDKKTSVQSEQSVVKIGRYCYCPVTHKITLGEIVDLLQSFTEQPKTLMIPEIPSGSFAKKLYSTYLSYLPKEKVAFPLKMNVDDRGSFTELVHTLNAGQVSINISKPGITKGQHWHNTKWEFFIVVAGHGLIQERKLGTDEIIEFEVSGDNIQCIHMLPGYTHNIINLSETENLVTVMYCNEVFDPNKPDTYFEPV